MLRAAFFLLFVPIVFADQPYCQHGFTLIKNKCLLFVPDKLNHTLAERKCAQYDATLVTVRSPDDNSAISQIVGTSSSLVWIGLYCFDSDPSKCLWDDGSGAVAYNTFAPGFPITDIGECVYYSNEGTLRGKWLSSQCGIEQRPFVCELPVTNYDGNCLFNFNGYCYKFMEPLFYDYAENACQLWGGHLASVHSVLENNYLTKLAVSNQTDYLIGARYSDPDVFSWSDGSIFDFSNVDPLVKFYTKCMALSYGENSIPGLWKDVDCNSPMSFICKRPAEMYVPEVTVTPLPSNPSNCNSSVLMAPGLISSPNYPNDYDNNLYCTYQISTLGSYNVLLQFYSFHTQYAFDILTVYDGDSMSSPMMNRFSGLLKPFSVVSTGNSLMITFETDRSGTFSGFEARFTAYAYGR